MIIPGGPEKFEELRAYVEKRSQEERGEASAQLAETWRGHAAEWKSVVAKPFLVPVPFDKLDLAPFAPVRHREETVPVHGFDDIEDAVWWHLKHGGPS